MLIQEIAKTVPSVADTGCDYCQEPAVIQMHGYGNPDCTLCRDCALQLVRKLTEDLCVFTKGGRHG